MCLITTSVNPVRFPAGQPTVKVLDMDQRRMSLVLGILPSAVQGAPTVKTISATGDGNFVVPANVTSLTLALTGAGGNGGAGGVNLSGCGGGGGGCCAGVLTVVPGQVIPYHVSASGAAASTWFHDAATYFATDGGNGGTGAGTQGAGGASSFGGAAGNTGGDGGNCVDAAVGGGGGGGGGAGPSADGSVGSDAVLGVGGAGGSGGGGGGSGGNGGNTGLDGSSGTTPGGGGGGSGAGDTNSSSGGNGQIVITYAVLGCIAGVLRRSTADAGMPFELCSAPTILDREVLYDLLNGPWYWDDLGSGAVLQGYEIIKTGEIPVRERA